jgi:DNA-directed RNA polymerase subunit omega
VGPFTKPILLDSVPPGEIKQRLLRKGPMARVTIEDCLDHVDNMYELVHLATKRARQLYKGSDPMIKSRNRVIVTALREIASGQVKAHFPSTEELDTALPPMAN